MMKTSVLFIFLSLCTCFPGGAGTLSAQNSAKYTSARFEAETGREALREAEMIIGNAIADSVFPGAVLGVLYKGRVVHLNAYGYTDYSRKHPVTTETLYDLASLTKILVTTTALMKLSETTELSIDDPVSLYLPDYHKGDKSKVTIRHLLLHESGLPPFRVYVDRLKNRNEILRAVIEEDLVYKPGSDYRYSDLGMILLGHIIEKVSGSDLQTYADEQIFTPLEMHDTLFNPMESGTYSESGIAPTEIDTIFGRGKVHGKAHDERAYFMDGVAGHAGLFSTAPDLIQWCRLMLNGGSIGDVEVLSETTIVEFMSNQSEISNRGFGFNRSSSDYFILNGSDSQKDNGPEAVGHTGFTGSSILLVPDSDFAVLLLTNRTYPYRGSSANINKVRAQLADMLLPVIN